MRGHSAGYTEGLTSHNLFFVTTLIHRLSREWDEMSEATSRLYCCASWLQAQVSLAFALEEVTVDVPVILVHKLCHAVQTEPVHFGHHPSPFLT